MAEAHSGVQSLTWRRKSSKAGATRLPAWGPEPIVNSPVKAGRTFS